MCLLSFEGYCFKAATHFINKTLTPIHGNESPFEILFNTSPNYENLKDLIAQPMLPPLATIEKKN